MTRERQAHRVLTGPQGPIGPEGPAGPGTGDVTGPASSVDSVIATFDGVTGKLLKSSSGVKASGGNIVPTGARLYLNYGGSGFDVVRSGQLGVVREGVATVVDTVRHLRVRR